MLHDRRMTYISPNPVYTAPALTLAACSLTLRDPLSNLLVKEVALLRDCIAISQTQWQFEIKAAAILPSELQMLAVFDASEFGVKQALAIIQSTFEMHASGCERSIWDGSATVQVMDWSAMSLRSTFIESAPVRARLVKYPSEWRFSTAFRADRAADTINVA